MNRVMGTTEDYFILRCPGVSRLAPTNSGKLPWEIKPLRSFDNGFHHHFRSFSLDKVAHTGQNTPLVSVGEEVIFSGGGLRQGSVVVRTHYHVERARTPTGCSDSICPRRWTSQVRSTTSMRSRSNSTPDPARPSPTAPRLIHWLPPLRSPVEYTGYSSSEARTSRIASQRNSGG